MGPLYPYVSMSEGERHVGLATSTEHVDGRYIIGDAIDIDEGLDHGSRLTLALARLPPFRLQNDAGVHVGATYPATTAGLNAAIEDVRARRLERPISLVAGNGVRLHRWPGENG